MGSPINVGATKAKDQFLPGSADLYSVMTKHRSMTADPAHCWLREQLQSVTELMIEFSLNDLSNGCE
jgi:hypothetical protein